MLLHSPLGPLFISADILKFLPPPPDLSLLFGNFQVVGFFFFLTSLFCFSFRNLESRPTYLAFFLLIKLT